MNPYIFVRDLELSEGSSIRVDCPSCKGRKTFTATKQQGIVLYNCYKADCGIRGQYSIGMSAVDIKTALANRGKYKEEAAVVPSMELPVTISYDLTNKDMKRFVGRWGLENTELYYDIVQHRAVFPIRGTDGRLIDAAGRTLRGDVPKWLRYTGNGSFYKQGKGKVAVVVEDCISAAVVAKCCYNVTGVAILGTSLNGAHTKYLSTFDRVLLALDPDAAMKSVAYSLQLRSNDIDTYAVMLQDDLKYAKSDDIQRIGDLANECID
jgi:hypothetical protein